MFTSDNIKLSEVINMVVNGYKCHIPPHPINTDIIRHLFHLNLNVIECFLLACTHNFFGIFFGIFYQL